MEARRHPIRGRGQGRVSRSGRDLKRFSHRVQSRNILAEASLREFDPSFAVDVAAASVCT